MRARLRRRGNFPLLDLPVSRENLDALIHAAPGATVNAPGNDDDRSLVISRQRAVPGATASGNTDRLPEEFPDMLRSFLVIIHFRLSLWLH
jgi:hypothetical protein